MNIELSQIQVVLDDKVILRSIHFTWKQGERIAVLGSNGSGKSTLVKVLAGLIKPSAGKVILPNGMSWIKWRRTMGAVFPQSFLYDSMTAFENLQFYARLYDLNMRRVKEVLDDVNLLHVQDESLRSFSKGMKQRMSLARALLHQPRFLLLDEPFDGLDAESTERVKQLLHSLQLVGTGWVFITHDLAQARALCDRGIVLHEGRIREVLHFREQMEGSSGEGKELPHALS